MHFVTTQPSHEIEASGQPVQDGAQTLKIAWHPDRSESTRGTSLSQRDSKLSHEIEGSCQPVQDGPQTLKLAQLERSETNSIRSPNVERSKRWIPLYQIVDHYVRSFLVASRLFWCPPFYYQPQILIFNHLNMSTFFYSPKIYRPPHSFFS